jgi:polysaccharide deacetylase family protein (PEP-CTERM system associated)
MAPPGNGRIENALTFDIEDYFQVSAFERRVRYEDWGGYESRVAARTGRLLDLLAERGIEATFFILGWVAERNPDTVRRIAAEGHEVACHGYRHRRIQGMTPEEFREDTRMAKRILEEIAGVPVVGFRAPSFSIVRKTLWALDVLRELGFRYDSSIYPIRRPGYGIPGYPRFPRRVPSPEAGLESLIEFPMSTALWMGIRLPVSGGGYLRMFSERYIRWGIERINREGRPAIFYLHPWEIDPGQPRIPCGWLTRVRHYRRIEKTEGVFLSLLDRFRFAPVIRLLEAWCPVT